MQAQSKTDKLFMRAKDLILIAGFIGTLFMWAVKYHGLPDEVSAQAKQIESVKLEIRELHDYTLKTDGRLARIEDSQIYTNKGIDEIKSWLRAISKRRNENE